MKFNIIIYFWDVIEYNHVYKIVYIKQNNKYKIVAYIKIIIWISYQKIIWFQLHTSFYVHGYSITSDYLFYALLQIIKTSKKRLNLKNIVWNTVEYVDAY